MVLLVLCSCSGEAATSTRAAAPPSLPSGEVAIAAPSSSTSAEPSKIPRDDYEPSVRMGNTTRLGAARVPFATYLVAIHNRIHPIFSDQLIAGLESQPPSSSVSRDLRTDVEMVIDYRTGKLVKVGIIRPSGVATFDVAVLDAVKRAQPFGPAPEIIASPGGNVYLHWEFHRDPVDACSARNARPYILKQVP